MTEIIGAYGGYRKTMAFGFACLVYHAICAFCRRNYDYRNDSLGKTTGQMVGAARSARQNIVEGSSRAGTSRENGGFTERLSRARLETRDAKVAASGAPKCPKCGKAMRKMVARKGRNAGNPFWSCTGYPDCNGTRNYVEGGGET